MKKDCLNCQYSKFEDLYHQLVCTKKHNKLVEHSNDKYEIEYNEACELFKEFEP